MNTVHDLSINVRKWTSDIPSSIWLVGSVHGNYCSGRSHIAQVIMHIIGKANMSQVNYDDYLTLYAGYIHCDGDNRSLKYKLQ